MIRRVRPPDPPPLAERVYPGGRVLLREHDLDAGMRRGTYALDAALQASLADVTTLCGGDALESLEGVLFLDTETTGLAGGAGNFVFLVGLASFLGGRLHVRQWLLPDPADEPGLLDALDEEAAAAPALVSFHGRGFDLPRLEERYLLAGRPFPFEDVPHMDLLVGARRVFRLRAGSVSLQRLERLVLGVERMDDLPGSECPEAWYDYLRGTSGPMERVLEHNLLDLLSLPALVAALALAARGAAPAPDVHAAGRVLARAGRERRALRLQRRAAAEAVDSRVAARAHEEAARLLRRRGATADAAAEALAATMADPDLPGPWLALAKDAEHRLKDYGLALECARRLQTILFLRSQSVRRRADVRKRIARVERKLARTLPDDAPAS